LYRSSMWRLSAAVARLGMHFPCEYIEPHFHFDDAFVRVGRDKILVGNWQSEKYFSEVSDVLRKDFMPRSLDDRLLRISESLRSVDSVSVHVRRGDYMSNSAAHNFHGVCEMDYYRRAMDFLRSKVPGAKFYVFTDDPIWVKECFPCDASWELVDQWDGKASWMDMWLMSRCRHHIISNSTYSWWGAWLNASHKKVVVAPNRWFNSESIDTSDLLPAGWLTV